MEDNKILNLNQNQNIIQINDLFNNFKNDIIQTIKNLQKDNNKQFSIINEDIKNINDKMSYLNNKINIVKNENKSNNNINKINIDNDTDFNKNLYQSQNSQIFNNKNHNINNLDTNISKSEFNIRIIPNDEIFEYSKEKSLLESYKESDFIKSQNFELNNNIKNQLNLNNESQNFNLNEIKISNSTQKIKKKKDKKRGKYKKKLEKSDFEKNIQYFEYIDDKKIKWKYSLNKYNSNNHTCYYNCSDSLCKGRGIIYFCIDESKTLLETITNEKFKVVKEHNLSYEEHSYVYKNIIEKDYENLSKNLLKEKLKDYKYLKTFLRIFLYKHSEIGTSLYKLMELL